MHLPTEADWGDYASDLDQKWAHDQFAGRTNQEMRGYFYRNVIEAAGDLRWMPQRPFRYYMLGFRDFVLGGDFEELSRSDAVSCFLRLILQKLETEPQDIRPIMPDLLPAVRHVAENQSRFEADKAIYGDFLALLRRIEALHAARP